MVVALVDGERGKSHTAFLRIHRDGGEDLEVSQVVSSLWPVEVPILLLYLDIDTHLESSGRYDFKVLVDGLPFATATTWCT